MNKKDSTSQFQYRYYPELDGLRGFAVLWVMAFHMQLPLGRDGLFGVDIFFVVSGFLITLLLVKEWESRKRISLKNFYVRRILRLYPALLLMLSVVSMAAPKPYLISTLFYFTNWVKAFSLQPDSLYLDHTWSLSIEEQYYLVWPIFLILLLRSKMSKHTIVWVITMLGFSSALARALVWINTNDWFRVYMGTDLRADGLLLGSAFGLATVYGLIPNLSKHKTLKVGITVLTCLFFLYLLVERQFSVHFIPTIGNFAVSIGTVILIARLIHFPSNLLKKVFSFSPLVKTGAISYGLYLWHEPVSVTIENFNLSWNPLLLAIIKITLTFFVAGLSYWLLEKPILKLKKKFSG